MATMGAMEQTSDPRAVVEGILAEAVRRQASDVHLEPGAQGYELRYRIDGLLQSAGQYEMALGRGLVTRLMVLAQLLTYRLDVPQEGRLRLPLGEGGRLIDLRLAIMPTSHGLRAAVRLPAELLQPLGLEALELPAAVLAGLQRFAAVDAGMLLLSGPAGSGKTTTIYALLQYIAKQSQGISIVTLEDPVERDLPKVTQIEVSRFGELTYERALRSILRQDPQVLMLGEIRDAATASLAVQAALSGHRLISTLHAATPGGAVARLFEMGLEPYQLTSALFGVVSQRLLRRIETPGVYRGRVPVAEMALVDAELRRAILRRSDAEELQGLIRSRPGHVDLHQAAGQLVKRRITDEAEVGRVLGEAR